ncbi:PREDICTED: uncharacterized protein LOC109352865 [Lupinus angustifolius]|uniref:uncharacterized protein LOC109352865 n=1 Tax=Lupinus angustifolius TaxID=3871 RepID=UPI00092FB76E|nr:PREDICTED: uncharacterized protein LOC109352865 [Lupinus angustifolius]
MISESEILSKNDSLLLSIYVNGFNTYWLMVFTADESTRGKVTKANKTQNKGCTNLLFLGFVQVEPSFHLGKPVANTSTYNGKQFEMIVDISHDPETNNWWVRLNNRNLGYYPEILFSNLAFKNLGGWIGMIWTLAGIPSPPIGSGNFPDNNLYRSCFIRQMKFQTDTKKILAPKVMNM